MPSNQYNSSYTGINHDTYVTKEQLIDLVYPIGSYYMSENSTNPTVLFGGSLEQIKDRFILAAGDSYTGGATGGSSSHSHTTNAGTTGGTAITIAQMPSHNHGSAGGHGHGLNKQVPYGVPYNNTSGSLSGNSGSGPYYGETYNPPWTVASNGAHTHTSQGSGSAHTHSQTSVGTSGVSNMPPYLVAYIWKRVA